MYRVAMRRKTTPDDYYWKHEDYMFEECAIDTKGRYWIADPFVFEKDGMTYIFYEALDLVTKLGKIGYSVMHDDGTFTAPQIIIDQKYHMSFPYIFEYDSNVYIMPESCGDWRVKLFKAKQFPDVWEAADYLLPDVRACDSIFIEKGEKRWLLANEMYHHPPVDSYPSCWVKNNIYEMNGLCVNGEGTKVAEGDYGIRNAGKAFWDKGKLYRIGQDCRYKQYGRGMVLFEIESIVPYHEKLIWSMSSEDMTPHIRKRDATKVIGVHTYNGSEHWEIIDFSQIREVNFGLRMKRLGRHISNFIAPVLYNLKLKK